MSIPTVSINRIGEHAGQDVQIQGWLHNRRSSGKIHFLVVRDGSGFLQVVMGKNDIGEEAFKAADTDASGELSADELKAAVDAGAFTAA